MDIYDNVRISKNYYFHKVNIGNENEVTKFKKLYIKKYKKLHILINHSHYKGNNKKLDPKNNFFFSDLHNYPTSEWNNTININLNGLFYVTKNF